MHFYFQPNPHIGRRPFFLRFFGGAMTTNPMDGKPRTNLITAAKGHSPFSRNSATIHATTETIAPLSKNAVQIFIINVCKLYQNPSSVFRRAATNSACF